MRSRAPRDPAQHARAQRRRAGKTAASSSASASISATSSSRAATSTATASTSPPAWRHRRRRAASPCRARSTTRSAEARSAFEDLGEQALKNIAAAGSRVSRVRLATPQPRRPSAAGRRRTPTSRRSPCCRSQHERRSRAGVFRRRHHRGHHHRPLEAFRGCSSSPAIRSFAYKGRPSICSRSGASSACATCSRAACARPATASASTAQLIEPRPAATSGPSATTASSTEFCRAGRVSPETIVSTVRGPAGVKWRSKKRDGSRRRPCMPLFLSTRPVGHLYLVNTPEDSARGSRIFSRHAIELDPILYIRLCAWLVLGYAALLRGWLQVLSMPSMTRCRRDWEASENSQLISRSGDAFGSYVLLVRYPSLMVR